MYKNDSVAVSSDSKEKSHQRKSFGSKEISSWDVMFSSKNFLNIYCLIFVLIVVVFY